MAALPEKRKFPLNNGTFAFHALMSVNDLPSTRQQRVRSMIWLAIVRQGKGKRCFGVYSAATFVSPPTEIGLHVLQTKKRKPWRCGRSQPYLRLERQYLVQLDALKRSLAVG